MSIDFRALRKGTPETRRQQLIVSWPEAKLDIQLFEGHDDLADRMVEQAIGCFPLPCGLAGQFLINGKTLLLPMATEEPSVIAAASFAATRIAHHGGFTAWADESLMVGQIFLEGFSSSANRTAAMLRITSRHEELAAILKPLLERMEQRGGGLRDIRLQDFESDLILKIEIVIDVRDAMGANLVNTCAEALRSKLEELSGAKVLMAILSNQGTERKAGASFKIPVSDLARSGYDGLTAARRLVQAARLAVIDPSRAVTHNKGIMNGISAFALACGNDTRAIEAAAHAWAARTGRYGSLTSYQLITEDSSTEYLTGSIELPLCMGTVGGAVQYHGAARANMALLGNPGARELAGYAAALGLAQNFAALAALSAEGIQQGHMKLHARRSQSS